MAGSRAPSWPPIARTSQTRFPDATTASDETCNALNSGLPGFR